MRHNPNLGRSYDQLLYSRIGIPRLLKNLNRDYANNAGTVSRTQLSMLLESSQSRRSQRTNVVLVKTGIRGLGGSTYSVSSTLKYEGAIIPKTFVNYEKTISSNAKRSELRTIYRGMNRSLRRGLRQRGFKVTPEARLKQVFRFVRNSSALIGGAYGSSAILYKIAENFISLPKIPIFP